jgi:hypothetical protein
MTYSGWDALKDFLGAVGPILIAVPWLTDFSLRYRQQTMSNVPVSGPLAQLRNAIVASLQHKIASPKMADFIWTIVGLLLIFLSFLIAFIRGIPDLIH